MPIIKSAKKRVKVANKAAVRNSKTKRGLKSALKAFVKKSDTKTHSAAQSNVDKAAKKGVIHKNKAARLKKQLSAKAKASGTKPAAKKTAPKKPAPAKKPAAKKTTTRKKA
jgi:small subunit ribosomal protein S20